MLYKPGVLVVPHEACARPQSTSYVSRRRLDAADFDPDETDNEGAHPASATHCIAPLGTVLYLVYSFRSFHRLAGLPLVYNEAKIAAYWRNKPGELARRWANFARISGMPPRSVDRRSDRPHGADCRLFVKPRCRLCIMPWRP